MGSRAGAAVAAAAVQKTVVLVPGAGQKAQIDAAKSTGSAKQIVLVASMGGQDVDSLPRAEVAELCVQALLLKEAQNKDFPASKPEGQNGSVSTTDCLALFAKVMSKF